MENTKKTEVHQHFWGNGLLGHQYITINDLQQGLSQKWWENGLLHEIVNYRDGKPYGKFIRFNSDGTIGSQGYMLDEGVFDGIYDLWAMNHWDNSRYVVREVFIKGKQELLFSVP